MRAAESRDQLNAQVNEVNSLATAINEMSATAHEVANSAVQAAAAASQVQSNSLDGMARMSNAANAVDSLALQVNDAQQQTQNLVASSTAIQSILSEIGGIADQTNLLALNAAIEAARAGKPVVDSQWLLTKYVTWQIALKARRKRFALCYLD